MVALIIEADDFGVTEHRFEVPADSGTVPGLLWSPHGNSHGRPMVLIGHGRTAHKRSPYVLAIGRRLARRGWNAVAIDAPGHGERRPANAGQDWPRPDQDEAARDWRAAIEFLGGTAGLDTDKLGYWGMSMGASLGISLLAGDSRFAAAALGLMHPNWPSPPGTRIRADAARVSCPVLFVVNWDDSLVPRTQAFELFELIGSTDKRLYAYPGDHGQLPDEAMTGSEDFLARHLGAG